MKGRVAPSLSRSRCAPPRLIAAPAILGPVIRPAFLGFLLCRAFFGPLAVRFHSAITLAVKTTWPSQVVAFLWITTVFFRPDRCRSRPGLEVGSARPCRAFCPPAGCGLRSWEIGFPCSQISHWSLEGLPDGTLDPRSWVLLGLEKPVFPRSKRGLRGRFPICVSLCGIF